MIASILFFILSLFMYKVADKGFIKTWLYSIIPMFIVLFIVTKSNYTLDDFISIFTLNIFVSFIQVLVFQYFYERSSGNFMIYALKMFLLYVILYFMKIY